MRASSLRSGVAALILVLLAGTATAQDKAVRDAQLRAQRAISKLQQEKSALAQEKDELTAKSVAAAKALAGLRAEVSRLRQRLAATDQELTPLRKEHGELKQRLDSADKQLSQTNAQCRAEQQSAEQAQKKLDAERAAMVLQLKQESAVAQTCAETNSKLHGLARGLIKQYEKDAAAKADPVFGLDLVKIKNRMQDYRDKIDELKLLPGRNP